MSKFSQIVNSHHHIICVHLIKKIVCEHPGVLPLSYLKFRGTTTYHSRKSSKKTIVRLETNRTVKLIVSAWVRHGSMVLPPAQENAIFAINFGVI